MKNKKLKRTNSKKKLLTCLLVLSLATAGLLLYFAFLKDNPVGVLNQQEQSNAEQAEVDAAKQKVEEESEDEPLKDGDITDESSVTSESSTLSGLTFSQANGLVKSAVNVSGADSGSCAFVFTDGDGRAITKTTKLSSGSCSISVSEAEFTMIGEYNLTAKFGTKSISKAISIN